MPAPTRRRTLPTTRRAGTATHAPAAPPARAAASSSDAARAARRAAIQAAIALPPSPATIDLTADTTVDDFEDSFDFDFDDDVIEHIEAAEAAAHSQLSRFATQPGRPRPRTAAPRRRGEPEIIEISD